MAGAHAGEDNCLSPAPATGDLIKVRRPIFVTGDGSAINQAGMVGTVSYKADRPVAWKTALSSDSA
ncbi:hypothetical protein [Mesorhizobium loti]|uniref:Uncharacterized protein n=1 Tax=Mesorhizobium loti R88b TaxID=935548 RepID=A0A6M7WG02_RHILI|nr:hypothetical protein [Mesorhizobium loti]QKD00895.1 hypothetical protein EB235_04800 [Mesorhizobium loti R88b]